MFKVDSFGLEVGRSDSVNVKQKFEYFGMQYGKEMNPLGKSNHIGGSSSNEPDTSDLNITYNSKLLDKSGGLSNMTPEYGKNSSSNRDSNDRSGAPDTDVGVSRIISVNDLTIDRCTAHSGSEIMSSTNMLPHFAQLTSADKFSPTKIETISWREELSPTAMRNKTENDNKSAQ